ERRRARSSAAGAGAAGSPNTVVRSHNCGRDRSKAREHPHASPPLPRAIEPRQMGGRRQRTGSHRIRSKTLIPATRQTEKKRLPPATQHTAKKRLLRRRSTGILACFGSNQHSEIDLRSENEPARRMAPTPGLGSETLVRPNLRRTAHKTARLASL